MFTVRKISGQTTPYVRGIISSKRIVQKITPIVADEEISKPGLSESEERSELAINNQLKSYQEANDKNKERRRIILAKALMQSPVYTITSDMTISDAWKIVVEKRYRHLPIINTEKQLIGLLSDRDLLRYFADSDNDISVPVSKIMHTDILTAEPEVKIRDVARVLIEERIGCMPIVNHKNELEGIITRSDILRALLVKAPLELWC